MKNLKFLLGFILISSYSLAQPIGSPGNSNDWKRGGNLFAPPGQGGGANIFGTMWNSPIYTYTNGINRTRLNGTLTTLINGVNQNVDGYFGIGRNGYFANNTPRTLFHLQGPDNSTFGAGGGWRRWMSTGMYVSENSDAMYVGMKPVPGSVNRSNAIINWSDDPWSGATSGVDKLSFVFTQANNGNGTGTSPINAASLDGYEFMMMASSTNYFNSSGTGEGTIGVGPVFTDAAPPQSRVHINAEERLNNWLQISNQTGTGQTASDGLRMGINGDNNTNVNGNALIYNQENRHLLFSTNNNTNFVNIANGITLERMRVTAIAAPTSLASGGYGVNNPAGLNGNLTRVAISHDPQSPVTRPLSLLHLGYNTGANSMFPTATDGWRNWMDIGMFVSNGTDNTYLGLKQESGIGGDRQDAVLNWGDNDASNPLFGPDNLRFIFTSTTTGAGNSPANSNNGLETARISPAAATTMGTNFGMMGIGDYSPTGPNAALVNQPNAKLDIDGDLRIRTVTEDKTLTQILAIDPTDKNRVHWRSISGLGSGIGNYCPDTPNPLTDNFEIPLNNFAYNFTAGNDFGRVNIGNVPCGGFAPARLYVRQEDPMPGLAFHTAITAETYGGQLPLFTPVYGTRSVVYNAKSISHAGLYAASINANQIYGNWTLGIGVYGTAFQNTYNYGVMGIATDANATVNIGIYGAASGASIINRAGYFNGNLEYTGALSGSDQMFKTNVEDITSATDVLKQLKPRTYNMDVTNFPQFNFQDRLQYGFIAQEVEGVLPTLVHESYMPSTIDSLGNEIHPAVSYKSLNYNALIPITVQAVNELNAQLNGIRDSVIVRDSIIGRNDSLMSGIKNNTLSDQNVKTNVQNLANSLDKIKQMRGVSYEWSSSAQNDMNLDNKEHIGFIAQEIAAIEPLLTFTDDSSLVHVNYDRVAPLLVESVKELDNKILEKDSIINHLQDEINTIKECLLNSNICIEGNRTMNTEPDNNTNYKSIELTNVNSIILDQNLPNPFAENTVINYNIPAEIAEAKLLFYDLNGRIIKELIIEERGESKLTVYGANLKTGIYTYSLIADGELIATKKMVKK